MPDVIDLGEFDDIVAQLREERPAIDAAFARTLDRRAAAGFSKPRRSLPRMKWQFVALPATGLAVAIIAISSPGGSPQPTGNALDSVAGSTSAPVAPQAKSASSGGAASSESAVAPSPYASGRIQEQTASMSLVAPAKEIGPVGDRILGVADQVSGFVQSSNVRATDGTDGGGNFVLRIPTARLGDALARLSRLAHVQSREQGAQDITAERNTAQDQLDTALAERKSLLERLAKATTDNETASLKARINDVNGTIAIDRASLQRVLRRAQYSTVNVTLSAKPKKAQPVPVDDGKWTPGDAAKDAGRVLEVAAGVIVIVGAVLLPIGLLVVLALVAQRMTARRGRSRMLDAV